ncbi:MAG: DUF1588 domain-containing protein [Myxococcales bacterium]|nr:DUF1588 domain-containing protein [Myxococcales bacterium]MDP3499225.1 DUF1588 domain-containing protein [Myxococcales bacterium]
MTLSRSGLMVLVVAALCGCPKKEPPPDEIPPPLAECDGVADRTPMRLLTRAEFDNTIADLLGDTSNPSKDFPREPIVHGFDNDAKSLQVTDESVTRYLEAAESIAAGVMASRKDRVLPCQTRDTACADTFISTTGRRLFRRALTVEERAAFKVFFQQVFASQNGNFETAIEWTLQVMLQSPQFLYRFEEGVVPPSKWDMRTPLLGTELASRLSYLLWASAPDDTLLDLAEAGQLEDPTVLEAQAKRLLSDARGMRGRMRFVSLWLRAEDISRLSKDPVNYPNFSPALAAAWQQSFDLFLRDSLSREGTLKALLVSDRLYVNDLMQSYANRSGLNADFTPVAMPDSQRLGVLTQPGFLARLSSPDQSSPIRRGIFVLEHLMCQPPPAPPPGFNPVPPAPNTGATTRERFAQHSVDPNCSGCHALIDPVGFGFENYDAVGAYRTVESGKTVDASGSVYAARDEKLTGPFNGISELARRLADSRQVHDCVASEWMRFAMGRGLGDGDQCSLTQVQEKFTASQGRFDDLLTAIIMSDTFRTRPAGVAR